MRALTPLEKARAALDLVRNDGEWPAPEFETGPQAIRAAAMQRAIEMLAEAVEEIAVDLAEATADHRR